MRVVFGSGKRRNAQTLVFFLLAWGTIMLLCGLAIDSGLLYLSKARMSRAVDGAALAAVGNFSRSIDPVTNRDAVALIMRNFATANFTDLANISVVGGPKGGTSVTTTATNGTKSTVYTYNFNDGTQDANGAFRRFVQVTLTTGSGGAITGATCNARCPVQTYFIGYGYFFLGNGVSQKYAKIGGYSGPTGLVDLKVSSSAVATRNPRLIMVVIDRSASMLAVGGGATGLPPAVVQFLDFFDTSSDNIGIVSFGSSARLEMPMTTNFIYAGTNNLIDAYESVTNSDGSLANNEPGVDPEASPLSGKYDPDYNTTGIRRMKFGGDTAADDGIRLALEQLMANGGFNDPDVVKYMVIFTDGAWNASRTMVAAPGYTNVVFCPTNFSPAQLTTNTFVSSAMAANFTFNGQEYYTNSSGITNYGPWQSQVAQSGDMTANDGLLPVPTLSPLPGVTNAIVAPATFQFSDLAPSHYQDTWLSVDEMITNEPLGPTPNVDTGGSAPIVTSTWVGMTSDGKTNNYTHNLDVWLQPGSVDYLYNNGAISNRGTAVYVSDFNNPTKHINIYLQPGDSNVLVVPGYVADGVVFDGLDLDYPDDIAYKTGNLGHYRDDNYQQEFMWPDDTGSYDNEDPPVGFSMSLQRQLMFRNYVNLLTGFYLFRPDEPLAIYDPSKPIGSQGIEPMITDQTNSAGAVGAPRPRYGLGAYYPSAGFYWPFGGEQTNNQGYVTNAVGVDYDATYSLPVPPNGGGELSRHVAYSINMLSSNAAPEWSGELFYMGSGGTNSASGVSSSSVSTIMKSGDWTRGAPGFMSPFMTLTSANGNSVMINEGTHNTNIVGSPSVWRPVSYNGSNFFLQNGLSAVTRGASQTGGFVTDGKGNYYANTMAWSGRPTHYFDFSRGSWEPIADNHDKNEQFLQMGSWKAEEYCWHARNLGVTIFTVGYGNLVTDAQQAFLAQIANSTNTTAGGGSNMPFNATQPLGQQFFATTPEQISNDFFSIGQAINAALTQ
jgi:Flp pilus assembly protein TadG